MSNSDYLLDRGMIMTLINARERKLAFSTGELSRSDYVYMAANYTRLLRLEIKTGTSSEVELGRIKTKIGQLYSAALACSPDCMDTIIFFSSYLIEFDNNYWLAIQLLSAVSETSPNVASPHFRYAAENEGLIVDKGLHVNAWLMERALLLFTAYCMAGEVAKAQDILDRLHLYVPSQQIPDLAPLRFLVLHNVILPAGICSALTAKTNEYENLHNDIRSYFMEYLDGMTSL